MLSLLVKVHDQATKEAAAWVEAAGRAHGSALASAGYQLRQAITTGMKQQAPGGETWPEASPWVQYGPSLLRRARAAQRRTERRRRGPRKSKQPLYGTKGRTPLGRLAAGARYEKSGSRGDMLVRIGFINPKLARIAAYHAEAHTVPVTAAMRRLIFAVGLGIRKSSITIPKREHVAAVHRSYQHRVLAFVGKRTQAALAGQDPKSIQRI
jgi:hypothetical protein